MPRKMMYPSGYDPDGLLSTPKQEEIKTSWMQPVLPSMANRFAAKDWAEFADCKGNTTLFFRHSCNTLCSTHPAGCDRTKTVRRCRLICGACPVLAHCRIWSVHNIDDVPHGIFGGLTERERLILAQALEIDSSPN